MKKKAKLLGPTDVYVEAMQKWLARVSSVMIWIGFFTWMSTMFELFWLMTMLAIIILAVIFIVWFDIKYILPNRQQFLGDKNPYLNGIKKDVEEIKKTICPNDKGVKDVEQDNKN